MVVPFLLALALQWKMVKLPPGSVSKPGSLLVPVGEMFTVQGPGKITVPEGMAATPAGKNLYLRCLAPGNYSLPGLDIEARKRAISLPARLDVKVYGNYPWAQALRHQLDGLVEEGCQADCATGAGNATVRASGPGFLDTNATVPLNLVNSTRELQPASRLILSNRPEKLSAARLLISRTLTLDGPQRLMIHHRNLPGQPPRLLQVTLKNTGTTNLRMVVDLALLGPSQDEIYVGHLALSRFLNGVEAGGYSGWELNLPPGRERILDQGWIKAGQTMSGYGVLAPLGAGQGLLRITAAGDGEELPTAETDDVQERTARGLFPPYLEEEQSYQAGGRHLFMALGDQPWVEDIENKAASPGNFGVVQKLHLKLKNPLDSAREVRLEASARGGPARAFFRIDGVLAETGLLNAVGYPLKKWVLQPGEERVVELESIPQAGSNYPIQLVLGDFAPPANPPAETPGTPFPPLP